MNRRRVMVIRQPNTGGGAGSDPREVYQGTRPAEWLRLPDYDKVADNTIYFLLALYPYGTNSVSLQFRAAGIATITAGTVVDGEFEPFENDAVESMQGQYYDWSTISRTFNYADYNATMSDGTKQIVVQFQTTTALNRIGFAGHQWQINRGVLDIAINAPKSESTFAQGSSQRGCLYYYSFKSPTVPSALATVQYIKNEKEMFTGSPATMEGLVKLLGKYIKNTSFYEAFRGCNNLMEVTVDISEVTNFNWSFRDTCFSLRRLLFTGGESLTSFPHDIGLNYTSLDVDAVLAFFNTLPDISTSETARTITLKSTPAATAGIPDTTLAVATNKGWTVVTA